ncbi:uncharacterized protein LOC111705487 isoform X2 [Eurytemora carolleeae]|uniref:uncharacterized protein LOC111705487 isoform X2 n=1 Tax=Eurytemora carolleeae TaxID=1294199 RepID=UPI000C7591B1|nr:uncharacterized protein LOC111705487 isoform X2 [Eurytemora carolleeae]|eukprot:XP_023333823.1 uncharacterized protein LOC111705487 isoform X2 [Eurytemora affinis]
MDPVVQARKAKLRELEQSLFGYSDNTVVGLPKVKDVDEYSARYGSYDTAQQEVPRVKTARQPNHVVFTAETKKKNQQSGQSYLDSDDESSTPGPAPTAPPLSRATTTRSKKSAAVRFRATSAKRSQQILDEEIESFSSRLSPSLNLGNPLTSPKNQLDKTEKQEYRYSMEDDYNDDDDDDQLPLIQVQGTKNILGRANFIPKSKSDMLLQEERKLFGFKSKPPPTPGTRSKEQRRNSISSGSKNPALSNRDNSETFKEPRLKTAGLLRLEQSDLEMSLSAAKFMHLKNSKIERIKAEERLDEFSEMASVKQMDQDMPTDTYHQMPGRSLYDNMPSDVYENMPSDTFKDIPKDVFENLPRAVTARQRDRDSVKKSASESDFVPSQPTDLSLRTPKPDVSARPKQGSRSSAPKEVGFIAMLFQGKREPMPSNSISSAFNQVESDYMFALFIQNQEDGHKASSSSARRQEQDLESEVGHFCAPLCPGFCQANLCIFHSDREDRIQSAVGDRTVQDPQGL